MRKNAYTNRYIDMTVFVGIECLYIECLSTRCLQLKYRSQEKNSPYFTFFRFVRTFIKAL